MQAIVVLREDSVSDGWFVESWLRVVQVGFERCVLLSSLVCSMPLRDWFILGPEASSGYVVVSEAPSHRRCTAMERVYLKV
jgi:hypothetical protein